MIIYKIIEVMSEGLTDSMARHRLLKGVLFLHDEHLIWVSPHPRLETLNRYVLPIFARTIYRQHRFDIPIEQYTTELLDFLIPVFAVDENGKPSRELLDTYKQYPDPEASMLADIANRWLDGSDSVFPKVGR